MIIDTIAGAIFDRARYYREDIPKRFCEDVKVILATERAVSETMCIAIGCKNMACSGSVFCKMHKNEFSSLFK